MVVALARQFMKWDMLLFSSIISKTRTRRMNVLLFWISMSADGPAYPVILLLVALLNSRQWTRSVVASLVSFAIELPIYKLVKESVRRSRPFGRIAGIERLAAPPDLFSFPSGHTAAAFVVTILIGNSFPLALPALFVWASLVGFSRVYLGVHYPTDVLAGSILGMASAKAGLALSSLLL